MFSTIDLNKFERKHNKEQSAPELDGFDFEGWKNMRSSGDLNHLRIYVDFTTRDHKYIPRPWSRTIDGIPIKVLYPYKEIETPPIPLIKITQTDVIKTKVFNGDDYIKIDTLKYGTNEVIDTHYGRLPPSTINRGEPSENIDRFFGWNVAKRVQSPDKSVPANQVYKGLKERSEKWMKVFTKEVIDGIFSKDFEIEGYHRSAHRFRRQ